MSRATTQEPIKTTTEKGCKERKYRQRNFPGCPGDCLSAWSSVCVSGSWSCGCLFLPGLWCWVPVPGALAPSLVVGCCPCLPGSVSCAGFREKGRRPKNRSRRSFARAGLFQVHPGIMAVLWGYCYDCCVDVIGRYCGILLPPHILSQVVSHPVLSTSFLLS